MSMFEFLMVLVSIIVGLGIAEILSGVARLIRSRNSIQGYWIHSIVTTAIFFALLQQWWEIWALRSANEWTFNGLLMMLTGPVGLFLIAHLIFPEPVQGANLREYYYGPMRPVYWLAAMTVCLATLFRPLIFGEALFSAPNATSLVFFFGFIALALSKRKELHSIVMPMFLLLLIFDIFQWSFVIGSG